MGTKQSSVSNTERRQDAAQTVVLTRPPDLISHLPPVPPPPLPPRNHQPRANHHYTSRLSSHISPPLSTYNDVDPSPHAGPPSGLQWLMLQSDPTNRPLPPLPDEIDNHTHVRSHRTDDRTNDRSHRIGDRTSDRPHRTRGHTNDRHRRTGDRIDRLHQTGDRTSDRPHRTSDHTSDRPHQIGDHTNDRPHRTVDHTNDRPHRTVDHTHDRPHRTGDHTNDRSHRTGDHTNDRPHRIRDHTSNRSHRTSEPNPDRLRLLELQALLTQLSEIGPPLPPRHDDSVTDRRNRRHRNRRSLHEFDLLRSDRSDPLSFLRDLTRRSCPVCCEEISSVDYQNHLSACTKTQKIFYNEDVLMSDAGECAICLDNMDAGDEIARLPCLCIYHIKCIEEWFVVKEECPQHPDLKIPD